MKRTRFLAKVMDYSLFYSFLYLLNFSFLINIVFFLMIPLLFIPFEALFYSTIKTTPGKWVFGISLTKRLGLLSSLKLAIKKGLLLLPLFFPPLNIFFLLFYLREDKIHQDNRWNQFEDCEIIRRKRNPIAKYLLLFCLLLGIAINYIPTSYKSEFISISKQEINLESWVEVKDTNLNFSIYFPSKPAVEKKEVDVEEQNTTLDVTEYTHKDKVSYSLVSSKIPSSWTILGSNYLFKSLGKAMEKHQGKILSKDISKHKSYPSMSYLLKNHEGGQTKGILILVKKTIYKLEVSAENQLSEEDQSITADFISSFNII